MYRDKLLHWNWRNRLSFAAMELADESRRALDGLCAIAAPEVRENGEWLAGLKDVQYEVSSQGDAALLHMWSAQQSLVRRVFRFAECVLSSGSKATRTEARMARGIDFRCKECVKKEKQPWQSQRCFPGCVLEVVCIVRRSRHRKVAQIRKILDEQPFSVFAGHLGKIL
jgi:hypothetical protein